MATITSPSLSSAAPLPATTPLRDTAALVALVAQLVVTVWIVPDWTPAFEPAYVAAMSSVVTSLTLLGLRTRGIRGSRFELRLLALFLAGMPLIYVWSVLLRPEPGWLPVELVAVPIYAALAWRGSRSPYVLAAGIAAHGVAWDLWHHHRTDFMPSWYPVACLLVDLGLGLYLALEAPRFSLCQRPSAAPPAARSAPASRGGTRDPLGD